MKENLVRFSIHRGYLPGAIGRIIELHGTYYHRHAGFGVFFESKVARGLADFSINYDETRDGLWLVIAKKTIEGSIAIDGSHVATDGAHLRWFITSNNIRGTGAGNELLESALDFCREKHYDRVYLETFEGLLAARHLYEKFGFQLMHQEVGNQWGRSVKEQRFELVL